jgi:hypothetical protein
VTSPIEQFQSQITNHKSLITNLIGPSLSHPIPILLVGREERSDGRTTCVIRMSNASLASASDAQDAGAGVCVVPGARSPIRLQVAAGRSAGGPSAHALLRMFPGGNGAPSRLGTRCPGKVAARANARGAAPSPPPSPDSRQEGDGDTVTQQLQSANFKVQSKSEVRSGSLHFELTLHFALYSLNLKCHLPRNVSALPGALKFTS